MKLRVILEFTDEDGWVDPKGKLHYLGRSHKHLQWLIDNENILNLPEVQKLMRNPSLLGADRDKKIQQIFVEKGWIKLSTFGSFLAHSNKEFIKNAKAIDEYIKKHFRRKDQLNFYIKGKSFRFTSDDLIDYGVAAVFKKTRDFER